MSATNDAWRCLLIHEASLDRACEDEANPVAGEGACRFRSLPEPEGWPQLRRSTTSLLDRRRSALRSASGGGRAATAETYRGCATVRK